MKIQPLYNYLLVEKIEENTSGIITPDTIQEKKSEGKGRVVAIGQGTRNIDGSISPLLVKKGDIILFNRYSEATIEKVKYLLVREEWIVAILKEEKNGKES